MDDISSTDRHKKMETEVFIHQNQRVSFVDAYTDVNGQHPVSNKSICKTCKNLLESAYVFRQMCRVADQPNHNVCRCCLQEKSDSNEKFMKMKNAVFEHNNKSVTFFEGYFDVNSLEESAIFTNLDANICEDCAVQLESAYAFRRISQKTAEIIQQTYKREQNKEGGQGCSRLYSTHWSSHNPNKKKSKKADKQGATIAIKTDHRDEIQQISFSFTCKKCPKTFKSKIIFSSHRKIKHRDVRTTRDLYARVSSRIKQNFCELCQIVFKTRQSHFSHNRSVHQMDCTVRMQQQQDFHKEFNSSSGSNILKKNYLEKIQYRCKKCSKAFQTQYSLATHVHREHLNTSHDFNTSAGLSQHKLGHGKYLHQCEKCPKAYSRRQYLLQHMRTEHDNLRLACQDCDKTFKSVTGLHDHKTTIHSKKLFKCKVCDKIYKNGNSLRAHTNYKHLHKTFQCEKCSKIYQRKHNFIMHYQIKHLNIVFTCQDCDKVFNSKSGLYSHKATRHLKILHQCEQCPKTFFEIRTLRAHVDNIHEKKQYSCQDCNKVFKTQKYLTLHINIIHLKKLFKCKNCEKTFTSYQSRDYHNKREHLKLTVECQKCKKKFASKQTLAVHMQKIHPNDSLA
jgi:KRAB domain-containing zinc finger protein